MSQHTRTIIKADPGWFYAVYCGPTDQYPIEKIRLDEIIAWELNCIEVMGKRRYTVAPITIDGVIDYDEEVNYPWAIKTPQGKFEIVGVQMFENENSVLKWFRKWGK